MSTPTLSQIPSDRQVRFRPYLVAGCVFFCGLLCARWICFDFDVYHGFLPWSFVTRGREPWAIYAHTRSNYPPFVLYLLTLLEGCRLLTHSPAGGWFSVVLLKLPNILAWAAGVPLCWFGLRGCLGERPARIAGLAYALCLPLFFNAAIWGQYDALLSLALAAALVALLHGRPAWAGAAIGWALSIKLQAVLVVPVAALYLIRRQGLRGLLAAAVAAAAVWLGVALPFLLHGQARLLIAAYTDASGYYPVLTKSASNVWYLLLWYRLDVRHVPFGQAISDAPRFGHFLTDKQAGLAALAAYCLWAAASVWRRPTPVALIWAAALSVFAFYMLPTEMHERYIVPAAALIALAAGLSRSSLILAVGLSVLGLLDQWLFFFRRDIITPDRLCLGAANLVLFAWATRAFWMLGGSGSGAHSKEQGSLSPQTVDAPVA